MVVALLDGVAEGCLLWPQHPIVAFTPASPPDGRTALMLSCVKGFRDSAHLLLEAGARPGATDAFGGTAM